MYRLTSNTPHTGSVGTCSTIGSGLETMAICEKAVRETAQSASLGHFPEAGVPVPGR
jgi:hypothetical protein